MELHERTEILLVDEETQITVTEKAEKLDYSSDDTEKIVYYTKTGKHYHYINPCGKGNYMECTLDEAKKKGLTPCGKCVKEV